MKNCQSEHNLQISLKMFSKIIISFKVIGKSILDPDDNFLRNS